MKKIEKKILYKYTTLIVLTLLMLIICIKNTVIREVLYILFISFVISYTLRPLHRIIQNYRISRRVSALLLICILILIVIGIITLILPSMFKESLNINTTFESFQRIADKFYHKIKPLKNNATMYVVIDKIYNKINNGVIEFFTNIFDYLLNLGQNIVSIAVIPIISYYFLSEGHIIGNKILNVFPMKSRTMIKKISCDIDKILGRYIVSQLLLCVLIGAATFIILLLLKVNFPVILSLLNAFFNIVPYFGPIFGALPAIFIALIDSPQKAVYTFLWLYFLQQIEGNIISPKITGDSISIHPLLVILLLIIGGKLAGFLGMILAIPIGVIIKIIYEDINYYLF